MAKVKNLKEKLHLPIYDAFYVPEDNTFEKAMTDPRVIRFFVDVQNKTRLETNLQAAGVLPSLNTFEARAMRMVTSQPRVVVERNIIVKAGDDYCQDKPDAPDDKEKQEKAENALVDKIQVEYGRAWEAANSVLPWLIYNSVTTLLVGEKTMIEMPTFWFPAGAGVSFGNGRVTNHGEPDPMATFRFAEPVFIEPSQNFRVEMLFPRDVPKSVAEATGPLWIWCALDGYLTRDVQ